MKDITDKLWQANGGVLGTTATANTGRRPSSSSDLTAAVTGVTSALDSLKQSQNKGGSLEQMLPVVLMARWMRNNG